MIPCASELSDKGSDRQQSRGRSSEKSRIRSQQVFFVVGRSLYPVSHYTERFVNLGGLKWRKTGSTGWAMTSVTAEMAVILAMMAVTATMATTGLATARTMRIPMIRIRMEMTSSLTTTGAT